MIVKAVIVTDKPVSTFIPKKMLIAGAQFRIDNYNSTSNMPILLEAVEDDKPGLDGKYIVLILSEDVNEGDYLYVSKDLPPLRIQEIVKREVIDYYRE